MFLSYHISVCGILKLGVLEFLDVLDKACFSESKILVALISTGKILVAIICTNVPMS